MQRKDGERGMTLVELLVASVVIGLTVVAVVAAVALGIRVSDVDRDRADAELVLRDVAERLEALPYESCQDGAPYAGTFGGILDTRAPDAPSARAGSAGPAGAADGGEALRVDLLAVRYWDGETEPVGFGAACPEPDPGLQELVLRVRSDDDAVVEVRSVYKRRPCPPGGDRCDG